MNVDYIDPKLLDETVSLEQLPALSSRQLSIAQYYDACIYPNTMLGGGVVDKDGNFVKGSGLFNYASDKLEGAYEAEVVNDCSQVVYLGAFFDVWGHCTTDFLRRLWFLNSESVSNDIKKLKFVYTLSSWGPRLVANFKRMLSIIGFNVDALVCVDKPTRFRCVYLPDSCFNTRDYFRNSPIEYTQEYVNLVDLIISRVLGGRKFSPSRLIYLSRARWCPALGREMGEKYIEEIFAKKGFEIIYPEDFSFDEMICLLQQAREFASTEGSCAHNAIFLQHGIKTYIVRKAPRCIKYQPVINQIRNLDVVYIDANLSNFLYDKEKPGHGPFFMYVNKRMAAFSGERSHFPLLCILHICYEVFAL